MLRPFGYFDLLVWRGTPVMCYNGITKIWDIFVDKTKFKSITDSKW